MKKHLIIKFESLNQADLLAKSTHIVGSLRNNPYFPAPWPVQVPTLEEVEYLVHEYGRTYQAALNGDRLKIAERNAVSQPMIEKLKKIAHYLEVVADGNEAALISTGYDLSHEPVRTKAKPEPDATA